MNALEHALQPLASIKLSRLPRATRLALEIFDRLDGGALAIELPDGTHLRAGHGPLVAHLRVRDHAVFDETLARGDIGFGESWMDGLWDTEDLTGLLTLLSRNRARIGEAIYGRMFRMLGHRIAHLLRANTRAGSRRNIEAHYDLGNDFYALWLDPSMTYSAAVFDSPTESLHDAQLRKYRRILGELGVQPGQTLLEVGCGWGGFAEVAATEFGCGVLCITLSPSQLAYARARAERGGFADRVDFALCDYRDVRGQYDHVVSIEMIEAVGERFWPTYFAQLSARLKPGGRCVVQAITIADALFGRYRRGTDFIQRHVFPGGMLPSPAEVGRQAQDAGLAVVGDFAFGRDYARTLAHWHTRFEAQWPAIKAQGFDERFRRMWRFYLAYCEAGFETGDIDVHHYVFAHAGEAG
ncbi:SAM-dependent methyltransferase [Thauera humireducens]|uniref:Cyclopropane-fatty-acyl-phospholipid synthase n=1 Tax=Thauera humireducens TaxID=1134435 RepID=A0A127K9T2_9RHOO|nr:cyclopropane-fatty-acyl-phospholipid synthase family protein [Thauera humireducens]AMO38723.1 cyclopropane-fatty-acyl-phospholipid synthase [Thauera humireducens]